MQRGKIRNQGCQTRKLKDRLGYLQLPDSSIIDRDTLAIGDARHVYDAIEPRTVVKLLTEAPPRQLISAAYRIGRDTENVGALMSQIQQHQRLRLRSWTTE